MDILKPTHRTRPGVEVRVRLESSWYRAYVTNSRTSIFCDPEDFAALFEPIPEPLIVHISLTVAKNLPLAWCDAPSPGGRAVQELYEAIALAQGESTPLEPPKPNGDGVKPSGT